MTSYKIHQMWGSENIKEPFKTYHEEVKKLNPDAEITLWTDETMLDFMREHCPKDVQWYEDLPLNVYRWDSFRYFMLFKLGGMYLDIDMEPTKSFKQLFDEPLTLCVEHPNDEKRMCMDIIVSNAMMISEPGHPFIGALVEELRGKELPPHNCFVLERTGPFLVTKIWKKRGKEVSPLNHTAFYPNSIYSGKKIGVFASHRFGSSWWSQ